MKLMTKEIEKKLPVLRAMENVAAEKVPIVVKFFSPFSNWTWYATEASAILSDGTEVSCAEMARYARSEGLGGSGGLRNRGHQGTENQTGEVDFGQKVGQGVGAKGTRTPPGPQQTERRSGEPCSHDASGTRGGAPKTTSECSDSSEVRDLRGGSEAEVQCLVQGSPRTDDVRDPVQEHLGDQRPLEVVDVLFFGMVHGFEKELGYFSLKELESVKGPFGLGIERDLHFDKHFLSEFM